MASRHAIPRFLLAGWQKITVITSRKTGIVKQCNNFNWDVICGMQDTEQDARAQAIAAAAAAEAQVTRCTADG